MYMFVYGTLKSGFGNNRLLQTSEFIGDATTDRPYLLTDCGFPFASETGNKLLPVMGEVYRVDDPTAQQRIDGLEGHPNFYERKQVPVTMTASGVQIPGCWMYLVPEQTAGRYGLCPITKGHFKWRHQVDTGAPAHEHLLQ